MSKIFTVIQGGTNLVDLLIEQYDGLPNIVWATQDSQPKGNLDKIEASSIELVTYKDLPFYGQKNVNLQIKSTSVGLDYVRTQGATHVLKIRSDLVFKDHVSFTEVMNVNDKIQCYFYVKHNPESDFKMNNWLGWQIRKWAGDKNIKMSELADYNYVCDYVNFGPIDEMDLFWKIDLEDKIVDVPAEHKFMYSYLNKKFGYVDASYDFLSEAAFDFFLRKAAEKNTLVSLKNKYSSKSLIETGHTIEKDGVVTQGYVG